MRGLLVLAGVERMTARAGGDRVRVVDREATTHQRVDEVNRRAAQVHRAEVVDDDPDAIGLDDFVAFVGSFLDGHPVLEARAATGRDEYAQGVIRRALLVEKRLELVNGILCDRKHRCAGSGHPELLMNQPYGSVLWSPV